MCTSAPPRSSALTTSPVAAFTSGGPPRKIVPCSLTMMVSSRHRRHIGAARRARAHHDGDLRNAERRQLRLVVEDAAEMLAVGKDLVLVRQVGAAGIDQVDAGQPVLARDLLRAQMLLHRHRVIGAALDGRVVADDDAFAARDAADAGDDAGGRHVAVIHVRRPRAARVRGTASPDRAAAARARAAAACRGSTWRSRDASSPPSAIAALLSRRSATSARIASALVRNEAERGSSAVRMTAIFRPRGVLFPDRRYSTSPKPRRSVSL